MIAKVTMEYAFCDVRGCLSRAWAKPKEFDKEGYEKYIQQIGWLVDDKGYTCPLCVSERSRIEDK